MGDERAFTDQPLRLPGESLEDGQKRRRSKRKAIIHEARRKLKGTPIQEFRSEDGTISGKLLHTRLLKFVPGKGYTGGEKLRTVPVEFVIDTIMRLFKRVEDRQARVASSHWFDRTDQIALSRAASLGWQLAEAGEDLELGDTIDILLPDRIAGRYDHETRQALKTPPTTSRTYSKRGGITSALSVEDMEWLRSRNFERLMRQRPDPRPRKGDPFS